MQMSLTAYEVRERIISNGYFMKNLKKIIYTLKFSDIHGVYYISIRLVILVVNLQPLPIHKKSVGDEYNSVCLTL